MVMGAGRSRLRAMVPRPDGLIRVGLALGFGWLGGVSYSRNLLNAILALPDRRIEPVLLVGNRTDQAVLDSLPAVEAIRSGWFDQFSPRWAIRKVWQQAFASDPFVERFLRANRIDVVSHADVLGKGAKVPAISWIVDFQHRQLPQFFTRSERWYRDHDFRLQCRHATLVIVSSHHAQEILATFQPGCLSKSRVLHFVANPVAYGDPTDLPTLRERYGIDGPYFHVPNQFWAHKNHRLILDALAVLKGRGEHVLVISTGATNDYRQPGYFDQVAAHAATLGVSDSFRTLGVVPYGDLVGLMEHSIAVINPSRSEGWSTTVEEAKSLGKRVILSDIPVHREQAPPDGVYVDPDDPAGLADALGMVSTTFDPVADRERSEVAHRELPLRIRAFGETYQGIVLEAAGLT
jgi:glycosyltransferase involved in cell wall biosynthesis